MAGIRIFNVHYIWEDCVSMALGALIVLTSWLVGDGGSQTAAVNTVIVGILVRPSARPSFWICVAGRRAWKSCAGCG